MMMPNRRCDGYQRRKAGATAINKAQARRLVQQYDGHEGTGETPGATGTTGK